MFIINADSRSPYKIFKKKNKTQITSLSSWILIDGYNIAFALNENVQLDFIPFLHCSSNKNTKI